MNEKIKQTYGWAILTHGETRITATSDVLGRTIDVYVSREDAELLARTAYMFRNPKVVKVVITVVED